MKREGRGEKLEWNAILRSDDSPFTLLLQKDLVSSKNIQRNTQAPVYLKVSLPKRPGEESPNPFWESINSPGPLE